MRKPLTTLALAAAVSLGAVIVPPSYLPLAYGAEKEQSPKIVIQGEVLSFPSPLRLLNDTYYAPAQNLLEKMGYAVSWNESEGTLAAAKLGSAIKLTPGTDVLLINRLVVRINKPTALLDGSVWLPVRSIAEALGAEVKWNSITQTIFIKPGFTSTLADILSVDTSLLSYEVIKNG